MTHTDLSQNPPLPDLDFLQRDINKWTEAMAYNAHRGANRWHYGTAALSFEQANIAIDKAREALELIEQEQAQ